MVSLTSKAENGNIAIFDQMLLHRHKVVWVENSIAKELVQTLTKGRTELGKQFAGDWVDRRRLKIAPIDTELIDSLADLTRTWYASRAQEAVKIVEQRLRRRMEDELIAIILILRKVLSSRVFEQKPVPVEEPTPWGLPRIPSLTVLPVARSEWMKWALRHGTFEALPAETYLDILNRPAAWGEYGWQDKLVELGDDVFRDVKNSIARSMASGEGMPAAWRRVVNIAGKANIRAETMVRTQVQRVSNDVAQDFYQANSDIIAGEEYIATLDDRTCPICGSYDRTEWKLDDSQRPGLPIHPRCRCFYAPYTALWDKLGVTPPEGERAGWMSRKDGTFERDAVPAKWSYNDWFKQQHAAAQKEILGPARYELWRQDKFPIRKFVNNGRVIPLDELSLN